MEQAELGSANLNSVNLSDSDLRSSRASFIQCDDVNLSRAGLRGADFTYARFTNVKMAGAKIDINTSFEFANWWLCDFYADGGLLFEPPRMDDYLIGELLRRFRFPGSVEASTRSQSD
jgi:Pentapeptide repeats (8 copies)